MTSSRPVTSLDDLLGYEEEKPTSHRLRPTRSLLRTLLLAAIGAFAGYGLLRLLGFVAPIPLLFGVLLTLLLVRQVLRELRVAPVPETLRHRPSQRPVLDPPDTGDDVLRDGLELASNAWYTRLAWLHGRRDPRQFVRSVQPRLVALIDERLRLRHGVTLASDPQRARQLLGEALWTFVSEPVSRNPSPRELAALVRQVEEL